MSGQEYGIGACGKALRDFVCFPQMVDDFCNVCQYLASDDSLDWGEDEEESSEE